MPRPKLPKVGSVNNKISELKVKLRDFKTSNSRPPVVNVPCHDLGALFAFKEPHGPHAVYNAVPVPGGVRLRVTAAALYRTFCRRIAAAVAARRVERQACVGPSGAFRVGLRLTLRWVQKGGGRANLGLGLECFKVFKGHVRVERTH